MTSGQSHHLLIVALLVTALAWAAPALATPMLFTAAGANPADIQATVDAFRAALAINPDSALKMEARPVEEFDDDLRRLVERMKQLMADANGIGLAATQVGVLRRLFVFEPDDEGPRAIVNPAVAERGEETAIDEEGCLSLQGVKVPVGVSTFADELYRAPRSWAERAYPNLVYYNRHDRGGHFAA